MATDEYFFPADELFSQVQTFRQKGITEFSLHDEHVSGDRKRLVALLRLLREHAPQTFCSLLVKAEVLDRGLLQELDGLFCSLDIPLEGTEKGGKLLFDKKFYAAKARLLNDAELTFGFQLSYAAQNGDSLKAFLERFDFAVQQYPNHIDFPQTQSNEFGASVSGTFSARDIRYARDIAFAVRTFYSAGRAVPWFLAVLRPLKIHPSRFFADFAEWQRCGSCDFKSGFVPENESQLAVEKMQLSFLEQKYEEKSRADLFPLVKNLVMLNGAFSRLAGEGEETVLETDYHPEDLLGPESLDVAGFAENVCMEHCRVRVFADGDAPGYELLQEK